MNIALDRQSTTKAILNINLEKDDYQAEVDKKLKEYSKQIQLKGFRPGKVPKAVVQRMYGKSILVEEVNKVIAKTISDFILSNKIMVVGEPKPIAEIEESNNWDNPSTLVFAFELGIASDFEIDMNALQLTHYTIKLDEAEVDKMILDYRMRFGTDENAESIEEDDDVVLIKLHFNTPDAALTEAQAQNEEEKPSVEEVTDTHEKPSVSLLEEFEEQDDGEDEIEDMHTASFVLETVQDEWKPKMKGLKKDETVSLPLNEVFGEAIKENLNTQLSPEEWETLQKGDIKFTIKQVSRTVPSDIDDSFLEKILPQEEEKTEENLRNLIRKNLSEFYTEETTKLMEQQAKKMLIEQAGISLPDEFLKEWLMKHNQGNYDTAEVELQYPNYATYVKWNLIVEKVSNESIEQLKLEEDATPWITVDDIKNEAARSIFNQYSIPYNEPKDGKISKELESLVQNYLGSDDGANYQKIYNQVSSNKILERIVSKAQKEEKEVSLDEYLEIVKNI